MHIAWIKTELLHPVDKGGKIRTYQMLRALRRTHRVTYITLDDGTAAADAATRAEEYCDELLRIPFDPPLRRTPAYFADLARNLASSLPYAAAKYRSAAMRECIRRVAARGVDVVVCDFLFPSVNVPDDLGCRTVLFQHNVEAMIWRRHAAVAGNPIARAYMTEQWRRMRAFERGQCQRYDHIVAVSDDDARQFRSDYGARSVSTVQTGVDVEYFQPAGLAPRARAELVFTGSMDWLPNEDAMIYFAEEILPRIQAVIPEATLTIVGRQPPPRIAALARARPAIRVTGWVPDVRPYLERGTVFVVPIRVGGGTRLKLYEAMAMEIPTVSTSVGAEGLPVRDGEDLLLADEPQPFADAVIRLLRDPARATALGRNAAARVRRACSWDQIADAFAEQCAPAGIAPSIRMVGS